MSNDPSAPSFDVSYARLLSRRLREGKPGAPERPVERPSYSRFQSKVRAHKAREFDAAAVGQSLRDAANDWGASAWHTLLDGCAAASGASAAFLLDSQGLVIATRGDIDEGRAESLGGRLMLTLDQAARMGENAKVVCVEVDSMWLSGMRGPCGSFTDLTLGLVGDEPLGREVRAAITQLFESISG